MNDEEATSWRDKIVDFTYEEALKHFEIYHPNFIRQLRQDIYIQIFDVIQKNTTTGLFDDLLEVMKDCRREWDIKDWYEVKWDDWENSND